MNGQVTLWQVVAAYVFAVAGGSISTSLHLAHKPFCALISFAAGTLLGVTLFAILEVESLLNRRFHVIVATTFVFSGHSNSIEFPGCCNVIAASAIVIGIFNMCKACGIGLGRLIPGGVALDHNFIATLAPLRVA